MSPALARLRIMYPRHVRYGAHFGVREPDGHTLVCVKMATGDVERLRLTYPQHVVDLSHGDSLSGHPFMKRDAR